MTKSVILPGATQQGKTVATPSGENNFSVAGTVSWDGNGSKRDIISVTFGFSDTSTSYRYALMLDASRRFSATKGINSRRWEVIGTPVAAIANAETRFILVRENQSLRFYVAGECIAIIELPEGAIIRQYAILQQVNPSGSTCDPDYNAAGITGTMGYFAIYNKALSAEQVAILSDISIPVRFTPDYTVRILPVTTLWSQGSPFNDYAPNYSAIGCGATMGVQVLNFYRWPLRFESHAYEDDQDALRASLRVDGRVPLDWNDLPNTADSSTEVAHYRQARPTFMVATTRTMNFEPNGGSTTFYAPSLFRYGYNHLNVMERSCVSESGTVSLNTIGAKMRAEIIDAGRPIFVELRLNPQSHWLVGTGFAESSDGKREILVNYGWGASYPQRWVDISNEEYSTYVGKVVSICYDIYPKAMVQVDDLPKVCAADEVTLRWAVPNVYTNSISHYTIDIAPYGDVPVTLNETFDDGTVRYGELDGPKVGPCTISRSGAKALRFGTCVSGIYRTRDKVRLTSLSELNFKWTSEQLSGDNKTNYYFYAQMSRDGAQWETIYSAIPPTGNGAAIWNTVAIPLGVYGGQSVFIRIVSHSRNGLGTCDAGSETSGVWMDYFKLTNVSVIEDATPITVPAPATEYSVSTPLSAGKTYQFKVTPVATNGVTFKTDATVTRIAGEGCDYLPITNSSMINTDLDIDFSTCSINTSREDNWWTSDVNFSIKSLECWSGSYRTVLATGNYGYSPYYPGEVYISLGGRTFTDESQILIEDAVIHGSSHIDDRLTVSLQDDSRTSVLKSFSAEDLSYLNFFTRTFATQTVDVASTFIGKTGTLVIDPSGTTQNPYASFGIKRVTIKNLLTPQLVSVITNRVADAIPQITDIHVVESIFLRARPRDRTGFRVTVLDEHPASITWHVESSRPDLISGNNVRFSWQGGNTFVGEIHASIRELSLANKNRVLLTLSATDAAGNVGCREIVVMFTREGRAGFVLGIR